MSLSRSNDNSKKVGGVSSASAETSTAAIDNETETAVELQLVQKVIVDSEPALLALSSRALAGHSHNGAEDNEEDNNDNNMLLLLQVALASGFYTGKVTFSELQNMEHQQQQQQQQQQTPPSDGTSASAPSSPVQNFRQLLETACSATESLSHHGEQQQLSMGFVKTSATTPNNSMNAGLRVSIKQRLPSGIVRTLYQTTLTLVDNNNNNNDNKSHSSLLQLSLHMVRRHDQLHAQSQREQQERSALERAVDEWRDTAEQLAGQWETEQTQLVRNFCDLYTEQRADGQRRCHELQQQIQDLQQQIQSSSNNSSGRGRGGVGGGPSAVLLPEALSNVPGDADHEMFDPELVQSLAAGQRVSTQTTAAATKRKKVPPAIRSAKQQQQALRKRRRRNPTLGTMEYFDVDAALEDVEGDDSSGTDQDVKSSLEATKQPMPPPVSKKSKSKAPPNKKKDNSKEKKNDDDDDGNDDSSTASDTSIFDAKMQGDIMAQLAKL